MRKFVLVAACVALLVAVLAPAAVAVNKQCSNNPCFGTQEADTLYERGGDGVSDRIYGNPENDRIFANTFGNDIDVLFGGLNRDRLNVDDGDRRDTVFGENGFDTCFVDSASEVGGGCNSLFVNGEQVR